MVLREAGLSTKPCNGKVEFTQIQHVGKPMYPPTCLVSEEEFPVLICVAKYRAEPVVEGSSQSDCIDRLCVYTRTHLTTVSAHNCRLCIVRSFSG